MKRRPGAVAGRAILWPGFRLEGGRWSLVSTHAGDAIVRAEPFDAIQLDLLTLWGESRQG